MKKVRNAAAILLISALYACSPKVDTSSPEAFQASIRKVSDSLEPGDRAALQKALVVLATNTDDPSTGLFSDAPVDSPIFMSAGDKIKGKSGKEIISEGSQQLRQNITAAIAKDAIVVGRIKSERDKVGNVLNNIIISNEKYSAPPDFIGQREPEISFSITNSSKVAIKAIYLDGVLSSPGRSVPWVQSQVSYDLPGGLEPGETKRLDLAPNMFGDWAPKDDFVNRKDLSLKLTVANAEGADGQKFLPDEASTLGELTEEMAALQKRLDAIPK